MKPTQEQVIAWAREAGFITLGSSYKMVEAAFTLAYEAGRKDENEACAKVCDSLNEDWNHLYVESCAEEIRARREQ